MLLAYDRSITAYKAMCKVEECLLCDTDTGIVKTVVTDEIENPSRDGVCGLTRTHTGDYVFIYRTEKILNGSLRIEEDTCFYGDKVLFSIKTNNMYVLMCNGGGAYFFKYSCGERVDHVHFHFLFVERFSDVYLVYILIETYFEKNVDMTRVLLTLLIGADGIIGLYNYTSNACLGRIFLSEDYILPKILKARLALILGTENVLR